MVRAPRIVHRQQQKGGRSGAGRCAGKQFPPRAGLPELAHVGRDCPARLMATNISWHSEERLHQRRWSLLAHQRRGPNLSPRLESRLHAGAGRPSGKAEINGPRHPRRRRILSGRLRGFRQQGCAAQDARGLGCGDGRTYPHKAWGNRQGQGVLNIQRRCLPRALRPAPTTPSSHMHLCGEYERQHAVHG